MKKMKMLLIAATIFVVVGVTFAFKANPMTISY
jgi:hypothetical protein